MNFAFAIEIWMNGQADHIFCRQMKSLAIAVYSSVRPTHHYFFFSYHLIRQ